MRDSRPNRASTLISVTTTSDNLFFDNDMPIRSWRSLGARMVAEVPTLGGRLYVDGRLFGGAQSSIPAPDPFEQNRKLAELRDAGLISPDEFEAKRVDILSRI